MRELTEQHRANLRVVSQNHGPFRLRAGEFRRHRTVAHQGIGRTDRCHGAVGGWHESEYASDLRQALLARLEQFVGTVAEKMLTYALGRGLEYYDTPAVRRITRQASLNQYRLSTLVLAIVNSALPEEKGAGENLDTSCGFPPLIPPAGRLD
jgi:hypothetical protein